MRRPVLLVSAVLAVLCAAPAASHAATVLAHPKRLAGGPELAGTRLVLLTEKASRRFALTLSGGGQATATVLRGRFADDALNRGVRTFDSLDFAGSASR